MKIHRYKMKNMHGYLNLEINFNSNLNFLTGINGSGKTSIVRSIYSLFKPSLNYLSHIDYDLIELEFDYENKKFTLYSKKTNGKIVFGRKGNGQEEIKVEFREFPLKEESFLRRRLQEEDEEEHYQDVLLRKKKNPLLKFILGLPIPLTLGIERRVSELLPSREYRGRINYFSHYPSVGRYKSSIREILGYIPEISIDDAKNLAEEKYKEIQTLEKEYTEELRNNMVLQSIKSREKELDILELKKKVKEININELIFTIRKLGFQEKNIQKILTNIYNKLKHYAKALPDLSKIDPKSPDFEKDMDTYLSFITDQSQLDRIIKISEYIKRYTKKIKDINKPIDVYIKTVNHFLLDSKKSIYFDKNGLIKIKIKETKDNLISSLSSGEIQIIIILTQIAFNKDLNIANIFIIDEPELSLHIKWQEIFIETILRLKPDLQIIVATHSPPIFSNYLDKCISLDEELQNE